MEEEINLRPYIKIILNKWIWVLGAGFVAGILAFIASSFIPPNYVATAIVTIVQSDNVIEFDPRFRETATMQPLNAFPELAKSDAILNLVLNRANIPEIKDIQQLAAKLSVEQGADHSLLLLTVTDQDPQMAARIANNWASEFVPWANSIYSDQSEVEVVFFEEQLAMAQENLETAEEALITYEGINPSETISNTLNTYSNAQRAYLQEKQDLITLQQDANELRTQISAIDNQNNYFISELTTLTLQLRTFHSEKIVPLLFTVDNTAGLGNLSPANQIALLDSLIGVIEVRSTKLTGELEKLDSQIQQLQKQLLEANTEYVRLSRKVQVAEETYLALATKVQEKRITAQNTIQNIRLASEATVPNHAVSSQKLVLIAAAIFLGLFGSIFILVIKFWWDSYTRD